MVYFKYIHYFDKKAITNFGNHIKYKARIGFPQKLINYQRSEL